MIFRLAFVFCLVVSFESHARPHTDEMTISPRSASDMPVKPANTEDHTEIGVPHHTATSATAVAVAASMLVIAYAFSPGTSKELKSTRAEGLLYLRVLFRSLISRQGP